MKSFEHPMADATIAIPTFNPDPVIFREVLTRAAAVGLPVLVVDMSTDRRVEQACGDGDREVTYVNFPDSQGVSQSRNRCVELAGTRRVIFLDSDALPEDGWARAMLRRLNEPDIGVVGAKILPQWETPPPRLFRCHTAGLHLSLFDIGPLPQDVPRIIGTSYALDRTRVPSPPFDEAIGRRPGWGLSGEENKLCVESRRMGFRVVYEPASVVFHHVATARLRWRWMWSRAHSSGREQVLTGREEALPYSTCNWVDRTFKAMIAIPFLAGKVRGVPTSAGAAGRRRRSARSRATDQ